MALKSFPRLISTACWCVNGIIDPHPLAINSCSFRKSSVYAWEGSLAKTDSHNVAGSSYLNVKIKKSYASKVISPFWSLKVSCFGWMKKLKDNSYILSVSSRLFPPISARFGRGSLQCAAERIYFLLIRAPPQSMIPVSSSIRPTCQGKFLWWGLRPTALPPIILPE